MRLLFEMDFKNYKEDGITFLRPSARGILIVDGKLGMVYSLKYDYYKFPGGGIEKNESPISCLLREVKEEVGLEILPSTIKEYGYVLRKEKGDKEDIFLQENYYYLCKAKGKSYSQSLDEYEAFEGFTLKWVDPMEVIQTNLNHKHGEKGENPIDIHMIEREAYVVQILMKEKIL